MEHNEKVLQVLVKIHLDLFLPLQMMDHLLLHLVEHVNEKEHHLFRETTFFEKETNFEVILRPTKPLCLSRST